jgi:hypothetical protein
MDVVVSLKDTAHKRLYSMFPTAVESACKAAEPSITAMDTYHWCTYRALMRRQGVFTNARNGLMNVNGTLCEPVIKTVTVPWGKFFQTEINDSFQTFFASIHPTLSDCLQSLYPKFPTLGLGEFQKQMLERQVETLRNTARDDITAIIDFVNNRQKEINRMFEGVIREQLAGTYYAVSSESGPGMWMRMRSMMHSEIKKNKVHLFTSTVRAVEKELRKLFDSIEDLFSNCLAKCVEGLQDNLIMMGALPRKDGVEREYGVVDRPKVKVTVGDILKKGNAELSAVAGIAPAEPERSPTAEQEPETYYTDDGEGTGDETIGQGEEEEEEESYDEGEATEREDEGDETEVEDDKENYPPPYRNEPSVDLQRAAAAHYDSDSDDADEDEGMSRRDNFTFSFDGSAPGFLDRFNA